MNNKEHKQYRRILKKGEVVFKKGEIGNHLIYLEKGILDVYINDKKVNSINADNSKDFVGEVGAILGAARTATIVASIDSIALFFPKIELEGVIKSSPSLGIKIIHSLCNKLVNSTSAYSDLQNIFNEYKNKESSILNSGNTEISLKNYIKGLLYLMEVAAEGSSSEAVVGLLDYFHKTNPWSIQHGEHDSIIDIPISIKSTTDDGASDKNN